MITSEDMLNFLNEKKLSKSEIIFYKELLLQIIYWIGDFDEDALKYFIKVKNKIPNDFKEGGLLYRGITLKDSKVIMDILKGKNLKLKEIGSWTRDIEVAKGFASNGTGIVISKMVPIKNVIIDFFKFYHSSLVQEIEKYIRWENKLTTDSEVQIFCNREKEVLVKMSGYITRDDIKTVYVNRKEMEITKKSK